MIKPGDTGGIIVAAVRADTGDGFRSLFSLSRKDATSAIIIINILLLLSVYKCKFIKKKNRHFRHNQHGNRFETLSDKNGRKVHYNCLYTNDRKITTEDMGGVPSFSSKKVRTINVQNEQTRRARRHFHCGKKIFIWLFSPW